MKSPTPLNTPKIPSKTPLQKAFTDYINNRYYIVQVIALIILSAVLFHINEFECLRDIIIMLIPILGAFFIPIIFIFIWAYQYKKGTRK